MLASALRLQFIEFGYEGLWPAGLISQFADFLALAVEHNNGRIAFDFVFFLEPLVRLLQFFALLFLARKIHLHEHKILFGVFRELWFRKHFIV